MTCSRSHSQGVAELGFSESITSRTSQPPFSTAIPSLAGAEWS